MPRKEGSKNFKTIVKEAEKHVGSKYVDQVIDPLYVVEKAMRHFFMLAESRKEIGGKLEEVNQLYERAAHLAALVAPYRHPKYATIKVTGDPQMHIHADASSAEIRAEIVQRLIQLAPVLELETVPELQDTVLGRIAAAANQQAEGTGGGHGNRGDRQPSRG